MRTLVSEILASKADRAITVASNASIGQAAALMSKERISSLVVVNLSHQPIGIVTVRDVTREVGAHNGAVQDITVHEAMTVNPFTCHEDTPVIEVRRLMTERKFTHMPVVKRRGNKFIGVISMGDIMARELQLMELHHQLVFERMTA